MIVNIIYVMVYRERTNVMVYWEKITNVHLFS